MKKAAPQIDESPDNPIKVDEKESFGQDKGDHIERLLHLTSELVSANAGARLLAAGHDDENLDNALENMAYLLERLKRTTDKVCLTSVGTLFRRYRRLLQELANLANKQIELELNGVETEAHRLMLEKASFPTLLLMRLIIETAIESPQQRTEHGKPAKGKLKLASFYHEDSLIIELVHDGDATVWPYEGALPENHRFMPLDQVEHEFKDTLFSRDSIAEKADPIGEQIRTAFNALQATIDYEPNNAQGSTFTIRLPLKANIVDGLWIRTTSGHYLIGKENALECVEIDEKWARSLKNKSTIQLRDEALPCIKLGEVLKPQDASEDNIMLIVEFGGIKAALLIHEFMGETLVIAKPLPPHLSRFGIYGASTQLANGEEALVIDVPKLLSQMLSQQDDETVGNTMLH